MPKLIINRQKSYMGMAAKMKILLDGEPRGYVNNGRTEEIDLAPGEHTIMFKFGQGLGLYTSKLFSFTMNLNERKTLNVSPSIAINTLSVLPAALLGGLLNVVLVGYISAPVLRMFAVVSVVIVFYILMARVFKGRHIIIEEF